MKTLAMIVLAAVFGSPGLQEKSSQLEPAKSMADMKKASKPGENHKQLDVLAGIWNVTIKYKLGGVEREGKATSDAMWVLGGRTLKRRYKTTLNGSPFNVVQYLGYEIPKKKFFVLQLSAANSGVIYTEGVVSDDGKVFTNEGMRTEAVTGKPIRLRVVTTIIDRDHYTVEWFQKIEGGKEEEKVVTLSHTRNGKHNAAPAQKGVRF